MFERTKKVLEVGVIICLIPLVVPLTWLGKLAEGELGKPAKPNEFVLRCQKCGTVKPSASGWWWTPPEGANPGPYCQKCFEVL